MQEQLHPLSDELIQRCLSIGPWEYNGKPLWHRLLDFAMDAGMHRGFIPCCLPSRVGSLYKLHASPVCSTVCHGGGEDTVICVAAGNACS